MPQHDDVPAAAGGYPGHWEADVLLRDGSTMRIRPIRPDDADALQRFHLAQSEESTYLRFFAPMRRLSPRDLARLTQVDHDERVALVMTVPHVGGNEIEGVSPEEAGEIPPAGDEDILAVGRYDRIDAGHAEVAFNVADSQQGRGLGSVLLEHLAAAARERGVEEFAADVLPGNAKMIRVFTDAGYDVVQRYDDGVLSLSFAIDPTQRSLDVMAEREQRTDAASMQAFLSADSCLVVAEGPESSLAVAALTSVRRAGWRGAVTAVGESLAAAADAAGAAWFPELAAAAAAGVTADLAVVAAPPDAVIEAMPVLASLGAHGVVVLSGGFARADRTARGQGTSTQHDLARAARAAGLRIVGPRSFGLLVGGPLGALDVTLARVAIPAGRIGLFCQSGAAALGLTAGMARRGLGLASFLSAGHRADVSGNDAMQYWDAQAAQEGVAPSVLALYLESVGNPRKFARVARRVGRRIPVVAVVGAGAALDDDLVTGSLPRRAAEETMLAAGVVVAPTSHALLDTAMLLSHQPLPAGDRIAVLSNSSSLARVALAQASERGVRADRDPVVLPALAGEAEHAAAVDELVTQDDWDSLVVVHTPPLGEALPGVCAQILRAAAVSGRTVASVVHGVRGVAPELTDGSLCVPAFAAVEDAVTALASVHTYARWRRTDHGDLVSPPDVDPRSAREIARRVLASAQEGESHELSRRDTVGLLRAYGIELLRSRRARSTSQALVVARELGWPVVVKSTDPHLRHRADLGGVRLDISGPIELVEAVRQMRSRLGEAEPFEVEIQAMAPLGVACVVRGQEDPRYGPVVSFGLSGDATDLLDDVAYAIPPLTTSEVARLVRSVRAAPRLFGHGGRPPVDVAALEEVVGRLSVLIDDLPEVRRIELRPVLVSDQGAPVLSATVVLAATVRSDGARRALRPASGAGVARA